jgi:hypothetical protein
VCFTIHFSRDLTLLQGKSPHLSSKPIFSLEGGWHASPRDLPDERKRNEGKQSGPGGFLPRVISQPDDPCRVCHMLASDLLSRAGKLKLLHIACLGLGLGTTLPTSLSCKFVRPNRYFMRRAVDDFVGRATLMVCPGVRGTPTNRKNVFDAEWKHIFSAGYTKRYNQCDTKNMVFLCRLSWTDTKNYLFGVGCLCQPTPKIKFQQ